MNIFDEGLKNQFFLCLLFIKNQRQSLRLSEWYLELVCVFEEASRHFTLFSLQKGSKIHLRIYWKYTDLNLEILAKIYILWLGP